MSILSSGIPCPVCEITGVHACPGRVLPTPTEDEEKALTEALRNIFQKERKEAEDGSRIRDMLESEASGLLEE